VPAEPYLLFSLRALGKGRLAVCKEDRPDAYDTVADIQNIMSRRNDLLRLYNAPSMNFFYQTSLEAGRADPTVELLAPAGQRRTALLREAAASVGPPGESGNRLGRGPSMGSSGSGWGGVVSAAHFRVWRPRVGEIGGEGDRNETRTDQERIAGGSRAGVGALLAKPAWSAAATAPTARVAVARCMTYGPELVPTMAKMFDQLGGLDRLVKGKRSR